MFPDQHYPVKQILRFLLHAGPEIAVASTKAYTAQLAVLTILAEVVAQSRNIDDGF